MYQVPNMQTPIRENLYFENIIFVCDFLSIKSIFYTLNILFSYKVRYESLNVSQLSLQPSEFSEISWTLHLVDDTEFLRVEMDSFGCHNKPKEFATGYPQEGLGWVHL